MLYQGHRFLGGIKHFWIGVSVWKTNLVMEELARQKRTNKVRDIMRSNWRVTVRIISSVLNWNRQTLHEILTFEMDMQKIFAKLVPKILTSEQKKRRNMRLDLLERIENDKKFFKHGITGDETLIFE